MTKTKYYDLQMDDSQDNYDVEVVNANLKKIDEQMKTRENATDALQEPEFTVADKRENIASKEKISKILGKIAKFFTDLKKVAFTGDYADLTNKPTYGKGFITDKSGSITINLDGTTITLDEAKNVIKLADTLKDKIGSALQPESIVNNQITTETGYALDARQANPNIDGTLAKQLSDLNGSLSNTFIISNMNVGMYKQLRFDFSAGEQIVFMWFFYPISTDSVSLYVVEHHEDSKLQLISATDTGYNPKIVNSNGKVSISFDNNYMGYMMFSTSKLDITVC